MIVTKENGVSFQLNEENHTASVILSWMAKGNIIIPRQITHESLHYNVISISENSFKENHRIRSIKFEKGSELQLIDKNAFFGSSIQMITIPNKVSKIEDCAFCECKYLKVVTFLSDSQLQSIGNEAFSYSSIENIEIPKSCIQIGALCFNWCNKLQNIRFQNDSQLQLIDKQAFSYSSIPSISIPKNVEKICDSAFSYCLNFQTIEFSEDSKLQSIEFQTFSNSTIKEISIPKSVKRIEDFAFSMCKFIQKVEFSQNSELNFIGKFAFYSTSVQSMIIPQHVATISENAFSSCENLDFIEFSQNSELKSIEKEAFFASSIQSISIPSSVENLQDGWCSFTFKLCTVSVNDNNGYFGYIDENKKIISSKIGCESNLYDKIIFVSRGIENAVIPDYVKCIGPFSFSGCLKLRTIEFSESSQLIEIDENAFSYSSLLGVILPPSLSVVKKAAFSYCKKIGSAEFLTDGLIEFEPLFDVCENLSLVSFPNAECIVMVNGTFQDVSNEFLLFVKPMVKIEMNESEDSAYELISDVSFF